jgi:hypothetical protein
MNSEDLQLLLEQKLDILIKKISKKTQNNYIEIFEYVNKNILEIKNIKYNEKKDPIKDYLIYLLKYNPSFIILNKNLLDLEKSFIKLCKKENLDISYITEDYLQIIIVEHMNSII